MAGPPSSAAGNMGRRRFWANWTLGRRPNDSPAASATVQGATSCWRDRERIPSCWFSPKQQPLSLPAIQTVVYPPARRRRVRPGSAAPGSRTPCWRLAEGRQGFPKRPCLRAFRCAGTIIAGLLSFPTRGLACCYAIVDDAIKLCDTQADGRIEQHNRFLPPERLKERIASLFAGLLEIHRL